MTVQEMYVFLSIRIQMVHGIRDTLKGYWFTLEQFYTLFCSNIMKCDWFIHILRFLHLNDNMNQPDKNGSCDRLWKMRTVFYQLHGA